MILPWKDVFLYCITGKGSPGFQREFYLYSTRKVHVVALGQNYYGKQSYVQGDHLLVDKTFHYITGKGSPAHRPRLVQFSWYIYRRLFPGNRPSSLNSRRISYNDVFMWRWSIFNVIIHCIISLGKVHLYIKMQVLSSHRRDANVFVQANFCRAGECFDCITGRGSPGHQMMYYSWH